MATHEPSRPLRICPRCGEARGVPILYGLPGREAFEQAQAGMLELGGCIVMSGAPLFVCKACQHRWGALLERPEEPEPRGE